MKLQHIFILLLALSLTACRDYFDEHQLDNDNKLVTDIRSGMTYTFTDEDYKAVATNATNIAKALSLDEDSTAYRELLAIATDKAFTETASADMYMPAVLAAKFPYLDNGTLCDVSYRNHEGKANSVIPFQSATSYTLTTDDYEQIWQKRGVSYLTPASLARVPQFLLQKLTTAGEGKIVILNYAYSESEPDASEFSEFLPYALNLSQLLAYPDTKEHEISGTVGLVKSSIYGRFFLVDGSDSIYVNGLYDESGNNKIWKTLGLKTGDRITIRSKYSTESGTPTLDNAVYVSHTAATARRASKQQITGVNTIYQLQSGAWTLYTNDQVTKVLALQPAAYDAIGSTSIATPETTLAKYLRLNYPYAQKDDQYLVAYKGASSTTADIFIYDGTDFVMQTGYVDESMSFEVKAGQWIANISTYLTNKFVGEGFGKFTTQHVNLDGLSYVWRYQASYGLTASAYVSSTNHRVEDWLVSPVIRLKKSVKPQMTFDQAVRYGTVENNPKWLSVLVTTDYTGDVTTTQWTKLDFPAELPDGSSWTFQSSGVFDLSQYNNQKIVIAFRYNTNIDGIEVSSAPTWEIQNLLIAEPTETDN